MRLHLSILVILLTVSAAAESTNISRTNHVGVGTYMQQPRDLTFMPDAYRVAALRMVIEEANLVAENLQLDEYTPIVTSNLVASYISPPRMTSLGFGNVTTSNYTYYMTVGGKFSFLTRTHLENEYKELTRAYQWPTNRMDTNGAYHMAESFLRAASMDVLPAQRQ